MMDQPEKKKPFDQIYEKFENWKILITKQKVKTGRFNQLVYKQNVSAIINTLMAQNLAFINDIDQSILNIEQDFITKASKIAILKLLPFNNNNVDNIQNDQVTRTRQTIINEWEVLIENWIVLDGNFKAMQQINNAINHLIRTKIILENQKISKFKNVLLTMITCGCYNKNKKLNYLLKRNDARFKKYFLEKNDLFKAKNLNLETSVMLLNKIELLEQDLAAAKASYLWYRKPLIKQALKMNERKKTLTF